VKALSAMVRLAEGLDRSHSRALAGIDLYPRSDDYLARIRTSGDAELELWAAHRHVAPLEKILGKPLSSTLEEVSKAASTRQQVFKKEWNRAEPQIKACELDKGEGQ